MFSVIRRLLQLLTSWCVTARFKFSFLHISFSVFNLAFFEFYSYCWNCIPQNTSDVTQKRQHIRVPPDKYWSPDSLSCLVNTGLIVMKIWLKILLFISLFIYFYQKCHLQAKPDIIKCWNSTSHRYLLVLQEMKIQSQVVFVLSCWNNLQL